MINAHIEALEMAAYYAKLEAQIEAWNFLMFMFGRNMAADLSGFEMPFTGAAQSAVVALM